MFAHGIKQQISIAKKLTEIGVVVKIIDSFTSNASVCELGCCVLFNKTANNSKKHLYGTNLLRRTDERNFSAKKVEAETVEEIDTIIKAMNSHPKSLDVCKYGCGTLMNITNSNCKMIKHSKSHKHIE